jgi:DNA processing protein
MIASLMMSGAISVISINNPGYPKLLREIKNPPPNLFYKGVWQNDLFDNCLGVVGSRRMSTYGRRVARKLITEIVARGITVVSGFMYGIDAAAHQACLDGGGKTVAVMPCGIEMIHPADQGDLYRRILDTGGLVLSEYEGVFPPLAWTYVKRNRIVAGLSRAVLVVEAEINSGSLVTARLAKGYGRKVLAVPGEITSETSRGTLGLIRQGARMVCSAEDVLDALGLQGLGLGVEVGVEVEMRSGAEVGLSAEEPVCDGDSGQESLETKIYKTLKPEPLDIEELAEKVGGDFTSISASLMMLILRGNVAEEGGKYYAN